jgi:hypothetical protein
LKFNYNEVEKTLELSDLSGSLSLYEMKDIFFGDDNKDANLAALCSPKASLS